MNEYKKLLKMFSIYVLVFGVLSFLITIIFFGFNYKTIIGTIIGCFIAYFNQFFFLKAIVDIYEKQIRKDSFLKKSYIIRYFAMFFIIGYSTYFFEINVFAMLIPLLSAKVFYYFQGAKGFDFLTFSKSIYINENMKKDNLESPKIESKSYIVFKDEDGNEIKKEI